MTDAMFWTLIGGFLTILTVMGGLMLRLVHSEIAGLRTEMRTEIAGVRTEIAGLRTEIEVKVGSLEKVMNARFDSVTTRLDAIDRDVQWLMEQYGRRGGSAAS